jgi:hypothetical protein
VAKPLEPSSLRRITPSLEDVYIARLSEAANDRRTAEPTVVEER